MLSLELQLCTFRFSSTNRSKRELSEAYFRDRDGDFKSSIDISTRCGTQWKHLLQECPYTLMISGLSLNKGHGL